MKTEGSVKQDHILEAAIKRFSHFGIGKTTLTEIADDLAISKPSLFYYFTDKSGLVTAVAKKILGEFLDSLEASLQSAGSVETGLMNLVEVKRSFFKKYFLLAVQGEHVDVSKVPSELTEIYQQAREKTTVMLSTLFRKGIASGELKPIDPKKTSGILLDTLSAFEHGMKDKRRVPDFNEFDELFDKQKEVLQMILNGLKNVAWKN